MKKDVAFFFAIGILAAHNEETNMAHTANITAAELASQYICRTDTAAERAKWLRAAQCALDGDDSDLRYMIGRRDAFEHYLEWANRNPRAADSFDGEFDQWFERNPWAAESYVPAMGSN